MEESWQALTTCPRLLLAGAPSLGPGGESYCRYMTRRAGRKRQETPASREALSPSRLRWLLSSEDTEADLVGPGRELLCLCGGKNLVAKRRGLRWSVSEHMGC